MSTRCQSRWSVGIDGHVRETEEPSRQVGHIEAPGLVQPVGWLDPFAIDTRDLLRVAMAVFQADRLSPRILPGSRELDRDLAWPRNIDLVVELEDTARWQAVADQLAELLWFLTDDTWHISFRCPSRRPPYQRSLFPEPVPDGAELALFSGGLDSMAGLWARNRQEKRTFVAVSVSGNRIRRDVQRCSVESLQELGADVRWVVLQQHLAGGKKPENSQRTRGFLFYCVGEAVSSTLRLASVNTYESGPGAINLPMNEAQVGAQNTRANHPGTLLRLEQLFSKTLNVAPELRMPFVFHTKGEICRAAGEELRVLAQRAISCDEGERAKPNRYEHCGLCTSCILRRAAIYAAIGSGDPTLYSEHRTGKHGDYDLAAFHQQALRLKDNLSRWSDLLTIDPALRHAEAYHARLGIGSQECRRKLLDLFGHQADEILSFYDACHPIALAKRTHTKKLHGGSRDLFSAAR